MWVPAVFKPEWLGHLGRQNVFLHMYARLASGITFDQASKELEVISHRAATNNRGEYTIDLTGWRYFLVPLSKENNSSVQPWTWVLFWSVLVLFLIVCLNASGLFVLRATQRSFEISVRLALGAGILRIARYAMFEAVAVCVIGACAAVFTAFAGVHLLNKSGEFGELGVSLPVLGFGVMMMLVAGTFCSAYPVWRAIRTNPADAINNAENHHTHSHTRQYVRRTLLIIQIAATTALLITGGLLLHTYTRLLATPLGFEADRITTMEVSLPPLRYRSDSSRRIFYETVVDRIRHLPGVSDASACTVVPFGYGENMQPFALANSPSKVAQQLAAVNIVLPDFFEALRIPLVTGRYISSSDVPGHEYAVVIDRNLADRYFPRQNAIGQQLRMGERLFSIVGIVGNIKIGGLDATEPPMLYLSGLQMPTTDMSILVKASRVTRHVPELVQSIVAQTDRDQPVYDIASLQNRIDASLSTRRLVVFLLTTFSAIAIVTTAIGLYGVLSYSVLLRGREFGIRSALGATPQDLGLLIFQSGMSVVILGGIFGNITAMFVAHYISAEIYDVRLGDALTWLSTTSMVLGIGVLACFAPSWRALTTNVMVMLKHE